jgi:hypothetical protein
VKTRDQLPKKDVGVPAHVAEPDLPLSFSPLRNPSLAMQRSVLQLQRSIGNQAVMRLMESPVTKHSSEAAEPLAINEPGDRSEREADSVADQVMRAPETPVSRTSSPGGLQRKCAACRDEEEEQKLQRQMASPGDDARLQRQILPGVESVSLQRKCAACEEEEEALLQRKEDGGMGTDVAPGIVHDVLRAPGRPLDRETRAFMEPRFGYDFSSVRVHNDARAAESARAVNASAYTVGSHVVFGQGQHAPSSDHGRRLLAHELTHVVQQGAAVEGHQQAAGQVQRSMASLISKPAISKPAGGLSRLQRQSPACLSLVRAPGRSNPAFGLLVQAALRAHFTRQVGRPVDFSFADASAGPMRTEGRDRVIPPQIFGALASGLGHPDLAYRRRVGRVMLLAEIKPASWWGLAFAEEQMANYIVKGNQDVALKARLGVSVFSPMTQITYRLPRSLNVDGRNVRFAWCGPGVIVYKAVEDKKKEDDSKKTKKPPAAGKFSLGLSINSSSSGGANAGIGVAINSHGVAVGTVSAGVAYNSQGKALGAVGAGATSNSDATGAGVAGAGLSSNAQSIGAGTTGAGKMSDSSAAGAGVAGAGAMERSDAAAAGVAGKGKMTDSMAAAAGVKGSGETKNVVGATAGKSTSGTSDGGTKAGDTSKAGQQGHGTPDGGTGTGSQSGAAHPGSVPDAGTGSGGHDGGTGDAHDGGTGKPADAGTGGKAGVPAPVDVAEIVNRLKLPDPKNDNAQVEQLVTDAAVLDKLVQSSSSAQKDLLKQLAQKSGGMYAVPQPAWVEMILAATQGLTPDDIAYLMTLEWNPAKTNDAKLFEAIRQALAARHVKSAEAAKKAAEQKRKTEEKKPESKDSAAPQDAKPAADAEAKTKKPSDKNEVKRPVPAKPGDGKKKLKAGDKPKVTDKTAEPGGDTAKRKGGAAPGLASTPANKIFRALQSADWDNVADGGAMIDMNRSPMLFKGRTEKGTRYGAMITLKKIKFQGKDVLVIDQVSNLVLLDDAKDGDGFSKQTFEDKSEHFTFFGKLPKGSIIDDGDELRMMVVE